VMKFQNMWIQFLQEGRNHTRIGLRAEHGHESTLFASIKLMIKHGCININIKRRNGFTRIDGELLIYRGLERRLKELQDDGWCFKDK